MRLVVGLVLAALSAGPALAQDMADLARDAIGVPMPPNQAAGDWTLESHGRAICRIAFSGEKQASKIYGASLSRDCAPALPPGIVGWKPVTDGLALVSEDGRILVDFNRITGTHLVSPASSGFDVELRKLR